jgi:hypothetical protein
MQVESFRGETLRRTSRTRSRSRFIVNSSCRQRAGLPDPKTPCRVWLRRPGSEPFSRCSPMLASASLLHSKPACC